VIVRPGAVVRESILLTDCVIESGAVVERAILDKRVHVEQNARVGGGIAQQEVKLALVGKNSVVPKGVTVEPEATIGTDVIAADYDTQVVKAGQTLETKRHPYDI
jgi:glucose-1-phosphate adenylyltransferase